MRAVLPWPWQSPHSPVGGDTSQSALGWRWLADEKEEDDNEGGEEGEEEGGEVGREGGGEGEGGGKGHVHVHIDQCMHIHVYNVYICVCTVHVEVHMHSSCATLTHSSNNVVKSIPVRVYVHMDMERPVCYYRESISYWQL